jgi:rare lipoprotein A (peptidoglycan hydrolase)
MHDEDASARTVDRRLLRIGVVVTVLAVPVLLIDNFPARGRATPATGAMVAAVVEPSRLADDPMPLAMASPTSPTTEPATGATTTGAAVAAAPTAPPKPRPATTTTTGRSVPPITGPPTTSPPTTAPPTGSEEGQASWFYGETGGCAHKTLPFGTVVTVVNLETGASTTCTVNDRGPFGAGRIIDLDDSAFAAIASLGQGVIPVRITW